MILKFLALFLLLLNLPLSASAIGPNDLSLLLPLPADQEDFSELLRTNTPGLGGALLPEKVTAQLPFLVVGDDPRRSYNQELAVVALRFDPCFREGLGSPPCRRQIRMVWQPVVVRMEQTITKDAALHSFYDLEPKEWTEFKRGYEKLLTDFVVEETSHAELQIHPQLRKEGYRSEFWRDLKTLVLRYAGAGKLTRVTQMNLLGAGNQWVFRGFEVEDGILVDITIPEINRPAQVVAVLLANQIDFLMRATPLSRSETSKWLLDDSKAFERDFSEAEIQRTLDEWRRIEDPLQSDTGTVDCASCHLAAPVMAWNEHRTLDTEPGPGYYFTDRLRAFGYFGTEPQISPRVRKETLEVLKAWTMLSP